MAKTPIDSRFPIVRPPNDIFREDLKGDVYFRVFDNERRFIFWVRRDFIRYPFWGDVFWMFEVTFTQDKVLFEDYVDAFVESMEAENGPRPRNLRRDQPNLTKEQEKRITVYNILKFLDTFRAAEWAEIEAAWKEEKEREQQRPRRRRPVREYDDDDEQLQHRPQGTSGFLPWLVALVFLVIGLYGAMLVYAPFREKVKANTWFSIPFVCQVPAAKPDADGKTYVTDAGLSDGPVTVTDHVLDGHCILGLQLSKATVTGVKDPYALLVPVAQVKSVQMIEGDKNSKCVKLDNQPELTLCLQIASFTGDPIVLLDAKRWVETHEPQLLKPPEPTPKPAP